jgi:uncharacterized membrane protein HdeD (DUF308 family)
LFALFAPGSALLALVFVFGFYALLDGFTALGLGWRHRRTSHWGGHVVQGAVSLIAGVIALVWPGPTVLALVLIIGVWSIVLGVTEIGEAYRARRAGSSSWGWLLAAGVVAVVFGVVLIASPGAGVRALLWIIEWFALTVGVVFIVWAFRLRRVARAVGTV